jgi:hypothetical protein
VASAGDDGYASQVPAALPNVIDVGGTELASRGNSYSEQVWNNGAKATGGGCSTAFDAPSWQSSLAQNLGDPCGGRRLGTDVAAVADDISVYDSEGRSIPFPGSKHGWIPPLGGTSASAPFVAGMIALAADGGKPVTPAALYGAPASAFHDITAGSNILDSSPDCPAAVMCIAQSGYDGPTGLGSPNGVTPFRPSP